MGPLMNDARADRAARVARAQKRRFVRGPRTVEAYLRAQMAPRYMERLAEIETEYGAQCTRLRTAYRKLREACGEEAELFADLWRVQAEAWPFDRLNELVRVHNEWYPAESNLPMDPRTGDYIRRHGRSYRRLELGSTWVLRHFPANPAAAGGAPPLPRRAPRD